MASDLKRPASRLTIIIIVVLAVSAAVIAMWRVSTTSTVQEAPYFPPGHIQIASNQKPETPAEKSNAPAAQAVENTAAAAQVPATVTPSTPAASVTPVTPVTPATPAASPAPAASPNPEPAKKQALGSEPSLSDIRDSVEQWRQSWQSKQAASYIEFYHPGFPNLTAFARQKNSVMGRAEFIEVKVSELKLSLEPGFTKAQFKQHYRSNTYESFDIKTQHWVMTNSGPRIIEETIQSRGR